jgi:hypothetical protein
MGSAAALTQHRAHQTDMHALPSPAPARPRQRNGERVFKLTANYDLIVGGLIGSGRISVRIKILQNRSGHYA